MHFSKQLVILRKAKGLTQQMIADKVGMHVTQIKRYEAGTSQPTLEIFRKILLALGVSADEMLFEAVIKELIEGMLLKHDAKRWTK